MLCAGLWLILSSHTLAQQSEQPLERTPAVNVDELPISVDRVEEDLQRPSVISLESTRPLFRVEIVAPRPRWLEGIDWTGTRDRIGPTIPIPSIHEQFMARVTPRQAQSFGAFEGADLFQVMVTSLIQGLAARKVADATKEALRKRKEEEARREVDEAIERWRKQLEEQRQRETK
jgi:hypothetical protein